VKKITVLELSRSRLGRPCSTRGINNLWIYRRRSATVQDRGPSMKSANYRRLHRLKSRRDRLTDGILHCRLQDVSVAYTE